MSLVLSYRLAAPAASTRHALRQRPGLRGVQILGHALPAGHALHPACDVSPGSSPYEPAAHGLATDAPAVQ